MTEDQVAGRMWGTHTIKFMGTRIFENGMKEH